MMSQPFVFIFTVVVIAMVFLFGTYMIYKLFKTECKVENKKFLSDLDKEVNRIYAAGFEGNSQECAIVAKYGQTKLQCELLKPSGMNGFCFVDMEAPLEINKITIPELKEEINTLKGNTDDNLFFSSKGTCQADSTKLVKLSIPEPICVTLNQLQPFIFILENQGKKVAIKKA